MEFDSQKLPDESYKRFRIAKAASWVISNVEGRLVRKVILFGSTVRGEAREDSDIDLCVLLASQLTDFPADISIRSQIVDGLEAKGIAVGDGRMEVELTCFVESMLSVKPLEKGEFGELTKTINQEGVTLYSLPITYLGRLAVGGFWLTIWGKRRYT